MKKYVTEAEWLKSNIVQPGDYHLALKNGCIVAAIYATVRNERLVWDVTVIKPTASGGRTRFDLESLDRHSESKEKAMELAEKELSMSPIIDRTSP